MPTAFKQVADNATSTTYTGLTASGVTSITVATGDGVKFPQPGNGFYLVLWNGTSPTNDPNVEKVVVTSRVGNVLTHSATTKTHTSPCNVGLLDSASNITDIQTAVNTQEAATTALTNRVSTLEANQSSGGTGGGGTVTATASLTFASSVSTSNISLTSSTVVAVDGYTLNATDIVLLTGQTDSTQNGFYTVGMGTAPNTWTRMVGFTNNTVIKGWLAIISNGVNYVGSQWALLAPTAGLTVGTSPQTWSALGM